MKERRLLEIVGLMLAMAILAGSSVLAQNIVTNGTFEAGNTGFTTDYVY